MRSRFEVYGVETRSKVEFGELGGFDELSGNININRHNVPVISYLSSLGMYRN